MTTISTARASYQRPDIRPTVKPKPKPILDAHQRNKIDNIINHLGRVKASTSPGSLSVRLRYLDEAIEQLKQSLT